MKKIESHEWDPIMRGLMEAGHTEGDIMIGMLAVVSSMAQRLDVSQRRILISTMEQLMKVGPRAIK